MNEIRKAVAADAPQLTQLAIETVMQSHGHSAPAADMQAYVAAKYTTDILRAELEKPSNNYYIMEDEGTMIGFSNIVFNSPCPGREEPNLTFLDRIYLLDAFHGRGLGEKLFRYNVEQARAEGQGGMWLHVWTENARALRFYERQGFFIVGSYDFRLSPTHTNPNHRLLVLF